MRMRRVLGPLLLLAFAMAMIVYVLLTTREESARQWSHARRCHGALQLFHTSLLVYCDQYALNPYQVVQDTTFFEVCQRLRAEGLLDDVSKTFVCGPGDELENSFLLISAHQKTKYGRPIVRCQVVNGHPALGSNVLFDSGVIRTQNQLRAEGIAEYLE